MAWRCVAAHGRDLDFAQHGPTGLAAPAPSPQTAGSVNCLRFTRKMRPIKGLAGFHVETVRPFELDAPGAASASVYAAEPPC